MASYNVYVGTIKSWSDLSLNEVSKEPIGSINAGYLKHRSKELEIKAHKAFGLKPNQKAILREKRRDK